MTEADMVARLLERSHLNPRRSPREDDEQQARKAAKLLFAARRIEGQKDALPWPYTKSAGGPRDCLAEKEELDRKRNEANRQARHYLHKLGGLTGLDAWLDDESWRKLPRVEGWLR